MFMPRSSAGHRTAEAPYRRLKDLILRNHYQPGMHLKVADLADELGVSTTPVREALNRLVVERLIDGAPGLGFFARQPSELEIRNLYDMNQWYLGLALSEAEKATAQPDSSRISALTSVLNGVRPGDREGEESIANATGEFTLLVAEQARNSEIFRSVSNINDRLYYVRVCESRLMKDAVSQLQIMFQQFHARQIDTLRQSIKAYHEARTALLPDLMRELTR